MIDPKIIEKIQKLFRLADKTRNASEGEAMNALEAAKRLMAEYNISMADIAKETTPEGANKNWLAARTVATGGSGRKQFVGVYENIMFQAVAKLTGTLGVRMPGNVLLYFGETHDVSIAQSLFKILIQTMWACSRKLLGPKIGPSHRQYAEGFSRAVYDRAHTSVEPSTTTDGGTFAMVVASKETWLAAQTKTAFPNLTDGKPIRITGRRDDPFAYRAGHEDGSKVDLAHKNRLN